MHPTTAGGALLVLALAMPAQAAPTPLAFGSEGHARVPFLVAGGHLWVRGAIGPHDSLWVAIDTGASASVMDEGFAAHLGLPRGGHHTSVGAGGRQEGGRIGNVTVHIGGLTFHRDSLDTVDLGPISAQSRYPLDLILGAELFQNAVVRFDPDAGVMDAWPAAHAPADLAGAPVPITLIENHPYVDAELELPGRDALAGRFVLDTGSSASVILAPDVVARDSLLGAFPRTLAVLGRGVGGEVRDHVGRASALRIGDVVFPRPLVLLSEPTPGRIAAAGTLGNIGGQVLNRCRVTYDYGHGRLLLERGRKFALPFEADMSGATLLRGEDGLLVRIVNPDSPAADAGLREGDVVTHVDGEPAARIDPGVLRERLRQEGRRVRLDLRRGELPMTVTLLLRRLI